MAVNWKQAQRKAASTARWAVTMTKVRIRRATKRTRWQLVTFTGKSGAESVGIVDLMAVRKDHRNPKSPLRRGDRLQIILIQVKGGSAAMPTPDDWTRLRAVATQHHADDVLLASWRKGRAAEFFRLEPCSGPRKFDRIKIKDLEGVFR